MRLCLLAAVVACTFAVPYGVQAQRSSCGGDTPNWLLVTVIGVTDTLTRIMREGAVEGKTQGPPCGTNVVSTNV